MTLSATTQPYFFKSYSDLRSRNEDDAMLGLSKLGDSACSYKVLLKTRGRWPSMPNPSAGIRESRWLNEHREEVADAGAPWIAIHGHSVVGRGETFGEVHALLKAANVRDALVAYVRPRQGRRPYRIA